MKKFLFFATRSPIIYNMLLLIVKSVYIATITLTIIYYIVYIATITLTIIYYILCTIYCASVMCPIWDLFFQSAKKIRAYFAILISRNLLTLTFYTNIVNNCELLCTIIYNYLLYIVHNYLLYIALV